MKEKTKNKLTWIVICLNNLLGLISISYLFEKYATHMLYDSSPQLWIPITALFLYAVIMSLVTLHLSKTLNK